MTVLWTDLQSVLPKSGFSYKEEVEEWSEKLDEESLKILEEPYHIISKWHRSRETYTYSAEASEQYRLSANEMAKLLNESFHANALAFSHVSKDKRTIRLYKHILPLVSDCIH